MLALHKIGAIAIPATNQLVEHDFSYRYICRFRKC
jgi:acetyl-CoA synthetase